MRALLLPLTLSATTLVSASCASQPPARPVAIDPANPAAQEAPRPAVTDLAASSAPGDPPQSPSDEAAAPAQHAHDKHGAGEMAPAPASAPTETPAHGATTPDKPSEAAEGETSNTTAYTCPMHPEVRSTKPGHCPKCGMNLVPKVKTRSPGPTK